MRRFAFFSHVARLPVSTPANLAPRLQVVTEHISTQCRLELPLPAELWHEIRHQEGCMAILERRYSPRRRRVNDDDDDESLAE